MQEPSEDVTVDICGHELGKKPWAKLFALSVLALMGLFVLWEMRPIVLTLLGMMVVFLCLMVAISPFLKVLRLVGLLDENDVVMTIGKYRLS